VQGGDSLPPAPPEDSLPPDTPPDSTPGGGGGGGGCGVDTIPALSLAACEPEGPTLLQIVSVETENNDNSFVAADWAAPIRFTAKTERIIETATIYWRVDDTGGDAVESAPALPMLPPSGASVSFSIQAPDRPAAPSKTGTTRWYGVPHGAGVEQKRLAVEVRAYIVRGEGDTLWSAPVSLRQVPADVLLQEYVDFDMPWIPSKGDVTGSTGGYTFSVEQFAGQSDYFAEHGLVWVQRDLLPRLDAMKLLSALNLQLLGINSGYRNPVHNWVHVGIDQGRGVDRFSRHQLGAAADLNAATNRALFYEISLNGAALGACMEPPEEWLATHGGITNDVMVRNYTHVHVEWNPFGGCPGRMQDWSESLIGEGM